MKIFTGGIQYAVMEYNFFEAREVIQGEKATGEYHIRIKDNSSVLNAANFFKKNMSGCDVGLVDPDGVLNLEYPIYVLVKSDIIRDSIIDILSSLDEKLSAK